MASNWVNRFLLSDSHSFSDQFSVLRIFASLYLPVSKRTMTLKERPLSSCISRERRHCIQFRHTTNTTKTREEKMKLSSIWTFECLNSCICLPILARLHFTSNRETERYETYTNSCLLAWHQAVWQLNGEALSQSCQSQTGRILAFLILQWDYSWIWP